MYAVVDIAGQQFKVEENTKYYVPKLDTDVDKAVTFDNVLLFSDGKTTTIGTPSVKGAKIKAKVLEHLQDGKVIVFKKKRRKGYRVKNGHRQQLSRIEVTNISLAKAAPKKAEEVKAAPKKAEEVKAVPKKAKAEEIKAEESK